MAGLHARIQAADLPELQTIRTQLLDRSDHSPTFCFRAHRLRCRVAWEQSAGSPETASELLRSGVTQLFSAVPQPLSAAELSALIRTVSVPAAVSVNTRVEWLSTTATIGTQALRSGITDGDYGPHHVLASFAGLVSIRLRIAETLFERDRDDQVIQQQRTTIKALSELVHQALFQDQSANQWAADTVERIDRNAEQRLESVLHQLTTDAP